MSDFALVLSMFTFMAICVASVVTYHHNGREFEHTDDNLHVFVETFAVALGTLVFLFLTVIVGILVAKELQEDFGHLFSYLSSFFGLTFYLGTMHTFESTLTGESLYNVAGIETEGETDVVYNDTTGETYVTTESYPLALHREETALDAIQALATVSPSFGYLYEDGSLSDDQREFVVLFDPSDYDVAEFVRGFNNGIDRVVTREDGYRYIDGFTSEGGLIFADKDWHWDGSVLVSKAMANENPEEYLGRLQDQYFTRICDCLLDEDTLRDIGFVSFDKRVHDERNMQYGKVPRGQSREETYEYISTHYNVSDVVFRNSWEIFVRLSDETCPYCEDETGQDVWDATDLRESQATLDRRSGSVPTCESCGEPVS